jgi:hypothetical protein
LQSDLNEDYSAMDKIIEDDLRNPFTDLWDFLHEYYIYQEQIEKENWIPKLEKDNFKVEDIKDRDRFTTADGTEVLQNPQKDIIAFIDWPNEDQQLFKPEALLR